MEWGVFSRKGAKGRSRKQERKRGKVFTQIGAKSQGRVKKEEKFLRKGAKGQCFVNKPAQRLTSAVGTLGYFGISRGDAQGGLPPSIGDNIAED